MSISRNIYISEYHLLHSGSEIKIRTIRHFSIEHRTERTSFVPEGREIKHTFNPFLQTVHTKSLIILTSQVICVSGRLEMNRVMSARLQIFRSSLDEIRSLSKVHNRMVVEKGNEKTISSLPTCGKGNKKISLPACEK